MARIEGNLNIYFDVSGLTTEEVKQFEEFIAQWKADNHVGDPEFPYFDWADSLKSPRYSVECEDVYEGMGSEMESFFSEAATRFPKLSGDSDGRIDYSMTGDGTYRFKCSLENGIVEFQEEDPDDEECEEDEYYEEDED